MRISAYSGGQACLAAGLGVESTRTVTLSALFDDPMGGKDVARERIPALLLQLASLETALAARLEELTTPAQLAAVEPKDRLLTPDEAAELMGVAPVCSDAIGDSTASPESSHARRSDSTNRVCAGG
jgi:hypothetical protein